MAFIGIGCMFGEGGGGLGVGFNIQIWSLVTDFVDLLYVLLNKIYNAK